MRTINADELRRIIEQEATRQLPIVPSAHVKSKCDNKLIEWGKNDAGRKGRHLEKADLEACRRGLLKKWKRVGASNAPVGWSLTDKAALHNAEAWARQHGWKPC